MGPSPGVLSRSDLFVSGTEGYHTFRVPSLAVTPSGAVLAFAEGRRRSVSDTGLIEIVLRRSDDGGATWGPLTVVVARPGMTCGNATPTVDAGHGVIFLPFCENREDGPEPLIFEGKAPRTAWMTRSDDDGRTWAAPREISAEVKRPDWSWFAFGPGHGLELASGRLVVPSVHAAVVDHRHSDPCRAHLTLSDDGGATWRTGGVVDVPTSSECEVLEIGPGHLYVNARYEAPGQGRISAWSCDGGETFAEVVIDPSLTDPQCQGSIARASAADTASVLLVHASGKRRERLALRVSRDAGRSFDEVGVLDAGPAAYSDVVAMPGGSFLCLYERGERHPYERIALARFRL